MSRCTVICEAGCYTVPEADNSKSALLNECSGKSSELKEEKDGFHGRKSLDELKRSRRVEMRKLLDNYY